MLDRFHHYRVKHLNTSEHMKTCLLAYLKIYEEDFMWSHVNITWFHNSLGFWYHLNAVLVKNRSMLNYFLNSVWIACVRKFIPFSITSIKLWLKPFIIPSCSAAIYYLLASTDKTDYKNVYEISKTRFLSKIIFIWYQKPKPSEYAIKQCNVPFLHFGNSQPKLTFDGWRYCFQILSNLRDQILWHKKLFPSQALKLN